MQEMEPILAEMNLLYTFTERISEFDSQWQKNLSKVLGASKSAAFTEKFFPLQENFNLSYITINHRYVLTFGKRERDIFQAFVNKELKWRKENHLY